MSREHFQKIQESAFFSLFYPNARWYAPKPWEYSLHLQLESTKKTPQKSEKNQYSCSPGVLSFMKNLSSSFMVVVTRALLVSTSRHHVEVGLDFVRPGADITEVYMSAPLARCFCSKKWEHREVASKLRCYSLLLLSSFSWRTRFARRSAGTDPSKPSPKIAITAITWAHGHTVLKPLEHWQHHSTICSKPSSAPS